MRLQSRGFVRNSCLSYSFFWSYLMSRQSDSNRRPADYNQLLYLSWFILASWPPQTAKHPMRTRNSPKIHRWACGSLISGREMAEPPLERSHQLYCKLLILRHAPRWNRTINPVIKSHRPLCWGVSEALPGNREMDSTARLTVSNSKCV
jgi:hypothetical protein